MGEQAWVGVFVCRMKCTLLLLTLLVGDRYYID